MTKFLRGVLIAMLFLAGRMAAQDNTGDTGNTAALGGQSFTALFIANHRYINAMVAKDAGVDAGLLNTNPVKFYHDLYYATGGGPITHWLGIPVARIVTSHAMQVFVWGLILIAGAFCSIKTIMTARTSEQTAFILGGWVMKLFAGALIVALPGYVYAFTMVTRDLFTLLVEDVINGSPDAAAMLQNGLGQNNLNTLNMDAFRSRAVERAINERVALTQKFDNDQERIEMGNMLNAIGAAVNTKLGTTAVQLVSADEMNDASSHLRAMGSQFKQEFAALCSMKDPVTLQISYPAGVTTPITVIGTVLNDPNKAVQKGRLQIEAIPQTPDNAEQVRTLTKQYEENVLLTAKRLIDIDIRGLITKSPKASLLRLTTAKMIETAEAAAALPKALIEGFVELIVTGINYLLVGLLGPATYIVYNLLIELNVAVLTFALPFWLLPATPKAFTGIVRALCGLAFALPAFQMFTFIADCIAAKILSLAASGMVIAGVISPMTGWLPALAITLGYIVGYSTVIVLLLFRTPKIVNAFLNGAGGVASFVGTMATGMAAGVMTSLGVAASPLVMGKLAASAPGAANAITGAAGRMVPEGLRSAAGSAFESLAGRARQGYGSLPSGVRRTAERARDGMASVGTGMASLGKAVSYRNVPPTPPPTPSPRVGPFGGGGSKPEELIKWANAPVRTALATAAEEMTVAVGAEDPAEYLHRRKR